MREIRVAAANAAFDIATEVTAVLMTYHVVIDDGAKKKFQEIILDRLAERAPKNFLQPEYRIDCVAFVEGLWDRDA